MNSFTLLVLAAGQGTRLKSALPKVLHRLAGKTLIQYVLDAALPLKPAATCVVVGHEAERVKCGLSNYPVEFAVQKPQLGTGHAVEMARSFWESRSGPILVLSGDVPLITTETLRRTLETHARTRSSLTLVSTILENPEGYGRVVRNAAGEVERIVEQKDASQREQETKEINAGIYCFESSVLSGVVKKLSAENAQREYYLTDCVGLIKSKNKRVVAVLCEDPAEVSGINSRAEMAQLEQILRERKLQQLMKDGVTVIDPASTYIASDVKIGADTVLHPNVFLQEGTVIGATCEIYPNVRIAGSVLEDQVTVLDSCVITGSRIERGCQIGPFAHLRNKAVIRPESRIGNFVEVKNSEIGDRTKAAHLSYLGDAQICKEVNIGAGTITCNYDGVKKHKTVIEDGVFIGSDSQLIAPVTIHRGAYVAAGSTITEEVPENSLAIARSRQAIKKNWKKKKKQSKKKG